MSFAITVVQPFASALVLGLKGAELRPWLLTAKLVGERVLIHAGAGGVERVKLKGAKEAAEDLAAQLPDPPRSAFVGWCVFDKPRRARQSGVFEWPVRAHHAFLRPLSANGRVGLWTHGLSDAEIADLG